MKTDNKNVFLLLRERNGEYEYTHPSVHCIPHSKDMDEFANEYARSFYPGNVEVKDDRIEPCLGDPEGYLFFDGEVFVEVEDVKEITARDYGVLRKYL